MENCERKFQQENIAYWSKRAAGYSAVNQEELTTLQHQVWRKTIHNKIQEHFSDTSAERLKVLDIGTGPGFFAIILAELGYQVTAVDYTAAMLKQAKENAGVLANTIKFLEMNAEALSFPEKSFDIIVSRNLTWNLCRPDRAYTSWHRVLKDGGLLLNFDANWYRYLHNEEAMVGHRADRQNVAETMVEDDTAGTDVEAMESIARRTPLSMQMRPGWDTRFLSGLGMHVCAETEIWKTVWTETERMNNASTPMFLLQAVKM